MPHVVRLTSLLILLTLVILAPAFGQAKRTTRRPAIGDKVKLDWAGREEEAEVIGYAGTGWIKVKFSRDGLELTPTLPPTDLRPVPKTAAKKAAVTKRKWVDATGKFSIEAEFRALHDGTVELEKADGSTVSIPLDKLSAADQEAARKLASGGDSEADNPFKVTSPPTPMSRPAVAHSHTDTINPAGLKETEPDWSAGSEILLDDAAPEGGLAPDPQPSFAGSLANRSIPVNKPGTQPRQDAFLRPRLFAVAPGSSQVVVGLANEAPGTDRSARLAWFDLAKGNAQGIKELPGNSIPLGADPTGQRIIARSDNFHIGTHGRIDVFDIGGQSARHLVSWLPYGDREWAQRDVHEAELIDKDHAVTCDKSGKLTVWKIDGAKALYSLGVWQSSVPAVSGGGKYLAVVTKGGIYVLEATSGKTLARFEGQPGYAPRLSFRPDGKQLACVSSGLVQVWDVDSGKMAHEVYLPAQSAVNTIAWPGDGYVLLNGKSLVDLEKRVVLWHYKSGSEDGAVVGGRYLFVATAQDQTKTLVHAALPHAEAKKTAAGLDPEKLLALKPGAKVALRMEVALAADEQDQIRDSLTRRLKENGVQIVDSAPLEIRAATEEGDTQSVEYRTIGRGFGTQSASVTKQIQKLEILEDGKKLWEVVQVKGAPFFLHTKGKDLNTAIAEQTKPDVRFFQNISLPKHLARPGPKADGAYGESTLTAQGVQ